MTSPLSRYEFLVIQFDPRDAGLAVLNNLGYTAANRDDAQRDAQAAAAEAQACGLPLQYVVIRLAPEATFPAVLE